MARFFRTVLLTAFLGVLFAPLPARARLKERAYQSFWCDANGGRMEVVLADMTRVDCVTSEHAVEADFAPKWAEAIGQALYYSMRTGRKPGILLIMESDKDLRYLERLMAVATGLGIDVWTITPGEVAGEGD